MGIKINHAGSVVRVLFTRLTISGSYDETLKCPYENYLMKILNNYNYKGN